MALGLLPLSGGRRVTEGVAAGRQHVSRMPVFPLARPSSHLRAAVLPSEGPHPIPQGFPLVAFTPPGGAHLPPQELPQEAGGAGVTTGLALQPRTRVSRGRAHVPRRRRGIEGATTGRRHISGTPVPPDGVPTGARASGDPGAREGESGAIARLPTDGTPAYVRPNWRTNSTEKNDRCAVNSSSLREKSVAARDAPTPATAGPVKRTGSVSMRRWRRCALRPPRVPPSSASWRA